MIRQTFSIPKYGWKVKVWYAVDDCYTGEIMCALMTLGANEDFIEEARYMLDDGMLNEGLTLADYRTKRAVVVIGITTSAQEFFNTYEHEKRHLVEFIADAEKIPMHGEEISYLDGYVASQMFDYCRELMCDCCRKKVSKTLSVKRL